MELQVNESGMVMGYALKGRFVDGVLYSGELPEDFKENYMFYRYTDDQLIYEGALHLAHKKRGDQKMRIEELRDLLSQSDYRILKFLEGELSEEEFAPIRLQRGLWRKELRVLNNQLKELAE